MKAVIRNTALNAAAAILDRGSLVVFTAMLSRSLSPDAFSQFGQFQLNLTTLVAVSTVGISVSAARVFAEHRSGNSSGLPLIGTMWLLSLMVAVFLGVAVIGAGSHSVISLANGRYDLPLLAGLVIVVFGIVANGGVLGLALFDRAVGIATLAATTVLGVGFIAARNGSAEMAAWALVLGYGATSLASSIVVLREVTLRAVFAHPVLTRRKLIAVTHLIGPLAGVTLLTALGNWLLGHIILWLSPSTRAFPAFIIGLQWYTLAQFLPGMLTRAIFPLLVGDGAQSGNVLQKSIWIAVALCVGTVLIVAVASPLLVTLYDRRVIDWTVLVAFSVAAIPQAATNLLGNTMILAGRQHIWLWLTALWFCALVSVAAAFANWNAVGAAAALFVSGAILAVAAGFNVRRWRAASLVENDASSIDE